VAQCATTETVTATPATASSATVTAVSSMNAMLDTRIVARIHGVRGAG
jgi:hypothetical protein